MKDVNLQCIYEVNVQRVYKSFFLVFQRLFLTCDDITVISIKLEALQITQQGTVLALKVIPGLFDNNAAHFQQLEEFESRTDMNPKKETEPMCVTIKETVLLPKP